MEPVRCENRLYSMAFQNDALCLRQIVLASGDHSGGSCELAARATASIVIAHTAAP